MNASVEDTSGPAGTPPRNSGGSGTESDSHRKRQAGLTLALLLLAAAAYAPAFRAGWVWDDQVLLEQQLPRFRTARDVLFPPADISRWSYAYYRPAVVASYLADRALFGSLPTGPHALNVFFHALATLLVWMLARKVFEANAPGGATALVAGAVFAVHPIHAESVSWMAGRSDLLATLGVLGATVAALHWRDRGRVTALAGALLALGFGLLAKESAVTALGLLPLAWLTVPGSGNPRARGDGRLRAAVLAGGCAAVTAGYLALREAAGAGGASALDLPAAERLARTMQAAAWYALKLVWPWPQSAIVTWDMMPGGGRSAVILAVAATLTVAGAMRFLMRRAGTLLLASGWFWVTLSLPLWVAGMAATNTPLAERYLYLPSVSIALIAGAVFAGAARVTHGRGSRPSLVAIRVAAALLCTAMLTATVQRAKVWHSALTLWTDTVRHAPGEGMVWENLGLSRWTAGDDAGALEAFQRTIGIEGYDARGRARAHNAIGAILRARGETEAAVPHLRRAVALNPAYAEAWYGLGTVYEARAGAREAAGDEAAHEAAMDLAIHYYRTAVTRHAGYHPARLKLAAVLAAESGRRATGGRQAEALALRREARELLAVLVRSLDNDPRPDARAVLAGQVGVDIDQLQDALR